jgi:hypothetical protein
MNGNRRAGAEPREARPGLPGRRRLWKWLGAAALAAGLIIWLVTRPRFDLSTPERCLKTFQRAMDGRRWSVAERCLSARCRAHYRKALDDRRIFDFYSPYGYRYSGQPLIPNWRVRSVETSGQTALARISSALPLIRVEEFGFDMPLVREADGLWRIDGPLEDLDHWYEEIIPEAAKGWAAEEERR